MMIMTPSELREHEFKGAGRNAYKADDVDLFFGEVAVAYEKLYRENVELVKRVSLLADRLDQHKKDEAEIKQAIISAQKAAEIIVREAQTEVEDAKAAAEKIIADAESDAAALRAEAERQAVADSDLLLSIARDKAEQIIKRAKEEAHTIIIDANNAASDTVGAANRTITSESIHFDMLRKEVSDFRASILAQYKTHIELISKLPELAVEEAGKIEAEKEEESPACAVSQDNAEAEDASSSDPVFIDEETETDTADIWFTTPADREEADEEADEEAGETVVKTTLPYDFFDGDTTIEYVDNDCETDASCEDSSPEDESGEEVDVILPDKPVSYEDDSFDDAEDTDETDTTDEDADAPADIPVSRGFSVDFSRISKPDTDSPAEDETDEIGEDSFSLFESIETIDPDDDFDDEEDDEDKKKKTKKRRGFFGRK